MKKTVTNLVLISFSFLIFSCSSNSPEAAAKAFFKHMYAGDFDKAKEYATSNTKSMLSMMESFGGKDQFDDQMKGVKFSYKVVETKIDGDKAVCQMEMTKDDETETVPVSLVKKDGKWLVNFGKEDMDKEGAKKESGKKEPKITEPETTEPESTETE